MTQHTAINTLVDYKNENLMYEGIVDGKHKFSGFGMGKELSEEEIRDILSSAFEEPSEDENYKKYLKDLKE